MEGAWNAVKRMPPALDQAKFLFERAREAFATAGAADMIDALKELEGRIRQEGAGESAPVEREREVEGQVGQAVRYDDATSGFRDEESDEGYSAEEDEDEEERREAEARRRAEAEAAERKAEEERKRAEREREIMAMDEERRLNQRLLDTQHQNQVRPAHYIYIHTHYISIHTIYTYTLYAYTLYIHTHCIYIYFIYIHTTYMYTIHTYTPHICKHYIYIHTIYIYTCPCLATAVLACTPPLLRPPAVVVQTLARVRSAHALPCSQGVQGSQGVQVGLQYLPGGQEVKLASLHAWRPQYVLESRMPYSHGGLLQQY